jgi:hypothetical protein
MADWCSSDAKTTRAVMRRSLAGVAVGKMPRRTAAPGNDFTVTVGGGRWSAFGGRFAIATYEVLGHGEIVLNPSDGTPFPDSHGSKEHSRVAVR